MKNRMLAGLIVAVLGLLIAIVPQWIFPTCAAMEGAAPMKCFWAARAEIGTGLLIMAGGLLMIFIKSREVGIGISIMTGLTGILAALLPTLLIGMCGMNTMLCRMTTLPALMILSVLTAAFGLINGFYLIKQNTRGNGVDYGQEAPDNHPHRG